MATCAIWGTEVEDTAPVGLSDDVYFDSPRAGGKYIISREAILDLPQCDDRVKARLTSWLVDQRNLGELCPKILSKTVDHAKQRPPLSVQQRVDRCLMYIEERTEKIGGTVDLNTGDARAQTESIEDQEVLFLADHLVERGYAKKLAGIYGKIGIFSVSSEGYARLNEIKTKHKDSSQAFVAMWFDESMDKAYDEGIAPGVREAGYNPIRIDRKDFIGKVDDEIIAEIRRSRFVVADFTQGESGARGGVYYEAGFAHGLDIPAIFTCREDAIDEVHFDTNHYNHIVWSDSEDLRARLSKRISAVIGDGPNKSPP